MISAVILELNLDTVEPRFTTEFWERNHLFGDGGGGGGNGCGKSGFAVYRSRVNRDVAVILVFEKLNYMLMACWLSCLYWAANFHISVMGGRGSIQLAVVI